MNQQGTKPQNPNAIPWWVKSLVILSFSGVLCYKIAVSSWNAQIDFPTLLSLLLAFFSVALAAQFYFKATDTSNAFYDNTYKFSQGIGELLARIESGFGERLRHLDEAYKGMRDTFDRLPAKMQIKSEETKLELKEEEEGRQKILKQKDQIIEDLMAKAQLKEEEKTQVLQELSAKETAFEAASKEIYRLQHRLREIEGRISSSRRDVSGDYIPSLFLHHVDRFVPEFWLEKGPDEIREHFRGMMSNFPRSFLRDLEYQGLADQDGDLTAKGIQLVRVIAQDGQRRRASLRTSED
ncbi:MAG: hypothetical protein ACLQPD_07935 [Desulfomonilaceae bacterium]